MAYYRTKFDTVMARTIIGLVLYAGALLVSVVASFVWWVVRHV